jgi:hypothetical protein
VVSALLGRFSKEGHIVAHDRKNEDQEQITGDDIVGKAAGEDTEFEDTDEFEDEDDQEADDEVEES